MKPQDRSSPRRRNRHRCEALPEAPGHGSESGARVRPSATTESTRRRPAGPTVPRRERAVPGEGRPSPVCPANERRRRPGSAPAVSGCDRLAGQERCGAEIANGPAPPQGASHVFLNCRIPSQATESFGLPCLAECLMGGRVPPSTSSASVPALDPTGHANPIIQRRRCPGLRPAVCSAGCDDQRVMRFRQCRLLSKMAYEPPDANKESLSDDRRGSGSDLFARGRYSRQRSIPPSAELLGVKAPRSRDQRQGRT